MNEKPRGWVYDRSSFRAWCPACDYKPEVLCPLHAAAPALLEALKDMICTTCKHPWCDRARQMIRGPKGDKS